MQCTYNITLRCLHIIIVAMEYSEYASVALFIQHAKHMHCIIICNLSGCTVFSHILS